MRRIARGRLRDRSGGAAFRMPSFADKRECRKSGVCCGMARAAWARRAPCPPRRARRAYRRGLRCGAAGNIGARREGILAYDSAEGGGIRHVPAFDFRPEEARRRIDSRIARGGAAVPRFFEAAAGDRICRGERAFKAFKEARCVPPQRAYCI